MKIVGNLARVLADTTFYNPTLGCTSRNVIFEIDIEGGGTRLGHMYFPHVGDITIEVDLVSEGFSKTCETTTTTAVFPSESIFYTISYMEEGKRPREMTIKEIEKELGYEILIKEGK